MSILLYRNNSGFRKNFYSSVRYNVKYVLFSFENLVTFLIKSTVCAFLVLVLSACEDGYQTIVESNIVLSENKTTDDTLLKDNAQNFYFSRLSKPNTFGIMFDYILPEDAQNKEVYVIVKGQSRSNYAQSNALIVVVTHNKEGEQLSWMLMPLRYYYTSINEWCSFRDSVRLPSNFKGKAYNLITVVAHQPISTAENFDLKEMQVSIKAKL
jgi:hypothetical protein